jgi:transposase
VKEHPDAYLREIAAHFAVGLTTIWNALHRLGVKYKKTKNLQRIGSRKTEKIYRIPKKPGQK